jgi:hypothetical protein
LARNIQPDFHVLLNELVADHHELYITLFNDTLKPKHHNLTHTGSILKKCGPLVNLSTNRMESKHKYFTDSARSTSSRKNITYTLALKEQLNLLNRSIEKNGFLNNLEFGPSSVVNIDNFEYKVYSNVNKLLLSKKDISCSRWVKYNGITYKLNMYVILCYDEN